MNLISLLANHALQLLDVRVGPGAAILPHNPPPSGTTTTTSTTPAAAAATDLPPITRLHLTYARKIYGGHQGARHFWRKCLPRLKYHNPSIPMTVKQTTEQDGPAALTIYFSAEQRASKAQQITESSSSSPPVKDTHAPPPQPSEKTTVLDLKDLEWKDIWKKVKTVTGARDVMATPEEVEQLKKYEEMRVKSEQDRVRVLQIRQAKKDQERMLQEARGEVERLRQA